eukprot:gnl/MRDRNA2_/MRDRNA2_18392_c0_seq1.p1 gnl/MRDRNA2_/MRDRNA2_18392_c0~~gnl/MRDRNA2_/MRDRNA2_18392_c0_seq1.p1  ORF type:complete len:555 (+),score=110.73 gnl/MRDRNA2_/MRDRNA2_18392_c0_seq1:80-1666(+)
MASYYSQGTYDTDPVAAFAQQLGIQQNEEESFMWLAEVGFQSPLPPRWSAHADQSTGYIYYCNRDDQGTSWQNPLVPYLKQVIDIGRTFVMEGYPGFFQEQIGMLWSQLKEDLDHWHGPFQTPDGRPYYVNSVTNLSSWEDPRIDAQYIFELQSSLLNSLEQLLPPPSNSVPRFGCDSPTAVKGRVTMPRPWLDQGAEIYTLEDGNRPDTGITSDTGLYACGQSPPRSAARRTSQRFLQEASPKQHLAELQTAMSDIGTKQKMIEESIQDQEEVQRLRLRHRVEQRRQRKRSQTPTPSRASATSAPSSAPQSPSNGKKFRPPALMSDAHADEPFSGTRPDNDKKLAAGQISRLQLPPADPEVPHPPPLPGEGGAGQYFAPIPSPKGSRLTPAGDRSRLGGDWMSPKLKKMTGTELSPEDKYVIQDKNPRGSFSSVPLSPCNAGVIAPPGATAEEARMLGMQEQKPVEVTPRQGATPRQGEVQKDATSDGKDTLLKRPGVPMGRADSIQRVDSNPSIEDAEDPLGATLR